MAERKGRKKGAKKRKARRTALAPASVKRELVRGAGETVQIQKSQRGGTKHASIGKAALKLAIELGEAFLEKLGELTDKKLKDMGKSTVSTKVLSACVKDMGISEKLAAKVLAATKGGRHSIAMSTSLKAFEKGLGPMGRKGYHISAAARSALSIAVAGYLQQLGECAGDYADACGRLTVKAKDVSKASLSCAKLF